MKFVLVQEGESPHTRVIAVNALTIGGQSEEIGANCGIWAAPRLLRATTTTLLLDASIDIKKVQDLLGHRHITPTQIYDKRRIAASHSASHDVPTRVCLNMP